ncbi:MAG: PKD-like domain-containing protein [Saprospiraceae bacterium]
MKNIIKTVIILLSLAFISNNSIAQPFYKIPGTNTGNFSAGGINIAVTKINPASPGMCGLDAAITYRVISTNGSFIFNFNMPISGIKLYGTTNSAGSQVQIIVNGTPYVLQPSNLSSYQSCDANYPAGFISAGYFMGAAGMLTIFEPGITQIEVKNIGSVPWYFNADILPLTTTSNTPLCSGETLNLTADFGAVSGASYSWSGPNSFTSTQQNPDISNVTTAASGTYTVTATDGTTISTQTQVVVVNPTPDAVATPSTQSICSGSLIASIGLTGSVSGTTFNWTRNNTASVTGIVASGSGDISGTLTNTTNAPVTVTFTITPTANGCAGTSITATVVVKPKPTINPVSNQTLCNGSNTEAVSFTGPVANTAYNWTSSNPAIGLSASGTGNIPAFTAVNTGTVPITSTITVTPFTAGMAYIPNYVSDNVSVINTATNAVVATIAVGNQPYGVSTSPDGSRVYVTNFGSDNVSVTNTATNTVMANIPVGYNSFGVSTSPDGSRVYVANPGSNYLSVINTATNTVVATIAVGNFPIGVSTSPDGSRVYVANYQSHNVSVINTATNAVANIGVGTRPVAFGNFVTASGCTGTPISFTITVNPTPTAIATPSNQTICSEAVISPISLTGAVTGTAYAWTRDNTASVTGIAASGSGDITGSLTNTTNAPVTVTFTITPTANGCPGAAITATVLVNPNPNAVATPPNQTICSAASISTIVISGAVSGTTYDWTRDNTSSVTGIAASGTGEISGALTNTTNAPITVTFTITPTANSCVGASITATVLVNPTPNAVATPPSQTICSAASISPIVLTGAVTGTSYAWTRNNTATVTGIATSGSGNILGTLTNTTSVPVTVTFTITPTANGCGGAPITATVLVNPTPNAVATPASQTICSATAISTIELTGYVTGTTYAWTRNNTATVTGIAASGSGNISGTLTNTTFAPITVTFTITPTANGCTGPAITATVLVNPTPNAVATPSSQSICTFNYITPIILTGNVAGTTFNWNRNNTATVTGILGSGSGNISGILINTGIVPVTVTFTITPTANGCPGPAITATVIVNPTPVGTISIAPNPACVGSTVQLNAIGGAFYDWSGPQGWTSNQQNPTILLTSHQQGGTYTVTITNAAGCPLVLKDTLQVNYPPIAEATYEQNTACTGSTLLLHGSGAGSYAWTGPNGFSSNQKHPQIEHVTLANSGIYTFTVTSPNGCTATTTLNITINTPPALSANPTLTQTCEGSKIQLFATGSGDFVWTGPATYTSTEQNPVIQNIPMHMSGTYTVQLTASTGCTSISSIEVKVYDQIHAVATASEDTICEGQSLQLHAEGGSTYQWNGPNGFTSNEQGLRIDNITPAASGTYYVFISNEGGCFGYAELTIVVKPSAKSFAYATPNPFNENSPVQFIASSNGVAYSWSGPLGFTSNQQNPFIKKVTRYMAGVYTVTITNENGCPSIVKVILRVLYTNKGGNTIDGDGDGLTTRSEVTGTVYPNPTNDLLYFDTQSNEAIEYVIYDVNGKMQVVQKMTSDRYISTSNLASGVYQIRWKSKDIDKWIVSKFVKIR